MKNLPQKRKHNLEKVYECVAAKVTNLLCHPLSTIILYFLTFDNNPFRHIFVPKLFVSSLGVARSRDFFGYRLALLHYLRSTAKSVLCVECFEHKISNGFPNSKAKTLKITKTLVF